jgi:NDP-sugar pyrophosphorylase family protein
MPVGDRPILEILVRQLARDGFRRLVFAVGHLGELIEAYFGDGTRWGVRIEYSREDTPLGTAGPLRAVADRLPDHFLVLNGDVLSDMNYAAFLERHRQNRPHRLLTISTHRRLLRSEYGVLAVEEDGSVAEYQEKPSYPLCVSEGVYAFSRETVSWIPAGARFDFPDLVVALLVARQPVVAVDHDGLWLDIGRPDDYERAQQLVADHPERFAAEMQCAAGGLSAASSVTVPIETDVHDCESRLSSSTRK